MVDEVQDQLCGLTPDLVVLSVGGGGLMNGILEGLHRVGWASVPVLAIETVGADSLNACVKAGEWVTLDNISRSVLVSPLSQLHM
jgi:L-serine/L-threonine ammonia-lyase